MSQLLQTGDRIDKYRVDSCIGVGGMGEVYLVTHVYMNVQRALKLLRLDLTEDDPTFRDRFVREARFAARFQHPNSIGVVDVESESESGFLYLVMEYVDGQSLHQYLQNGTFPEKQMLHVCREVARALDAAWREMQLVHRDIKPGNIMISRSGEVKLADLGIAKSVGSGSGMTVALTMEGSMIGTPEYASPEQCRDASHVDTRADIYSLGATMYEMLTRTRPFQGKNAFDTVAKVLQEPLPPLRERNAEISEETAALVERMMSKDPAVRPQSMGELIGIIDSMIGRAEDEFAPSMQDLDALIQTQAVQVAGEMTLVQSRKMKKNRRYEGVLLGLIIAVTLTMGGILLYNYIAHQHRLERIREVTDKKIRAIELENENTRHAMLEQQKRPGIILNYSGTMLLHFYPGNPETDYSIPEGVSMIGRLAFENCINLQNIICPDSTWRIEDDAFAGCHNLRTLSVPSNCHVGKVPANVRIVRRRR